MKLVHGNSGFEAPVIVDTRFVVHNTPAILSSSNSVTYSNKMHFWRGMPSHAYASGAFNRYTVTTVGALLHLDHRYPHA